MLLGVYAKSKRLVGKLWKGSGKPLASEEAGGDPAQEDRRDQGCSQHISSLSHKPLANGSAA